MKHVLPILVLAAAAAGPAAAQTESADEAVVEGKCSYSNRLAPLLEQGHVFIECDRLEMERTDGQVTVTFSFPARMHAFEMRGRFGELGKYEVTSVRRRSWGAWREAEGTCEFDRPGSDYPAVACLVKSGARYYVVNFEPEG